MSGATILGGRVVRRPRPVTGPARTFPCRGALSLRFPQSDVHRRSPHWIGLGQDRDLARGSGVEHPRSRFPVRVKCTEQVRDLHQAAGEPVADGRRRPSAQAQNVSRGEGQPHDAIAGDAFAVPLGRSGWSSAARANCAGALMRPHSVGVSLTRIVGGVPVRGDREVPGRSGGAQSPAARRLSGPGRFRVVIQGDSGSSERPRWCVPGGTPHGRCGARVTCSVPFVAGATRGEVKMTISATPELLYALVTDVTRMGEWSPECRRCEWLDGASGPSVGARFRGHNRIARYRWTTTSQVTAAEPGREFAFNVVEEGRESTRWRYLFEPSDEGTVVTESYEFCWAPWVHVVTNILMRRDRGLQRGMERTLRRLKAAAEEGSAS